MIWLKLFLEFLTILEILKLYFASWNQSLQILKGRFPNILLCLQSDYCKKFSQFCSLIFYFKCLYKKLRITSNIVFFLVWLGIHHKSCSQKSEKSHAKVFWPLQFVHMVLNYSLESMADYPKPDFLKIASSLILLLNLGSSLM